MKGLWLWLVMFCVMGSNLWMDALHISFPNTNNVNQYLLCLSRMMDINKSKLRITYKYQQHDMKTTNMYYNAKMNKHWCQNILALRRIY